MDRRLCLGKLVKNKNLKASAEESKKKILLIITERGGSGTLTSTLKLLEIVSEPVKVEKMRPIHKNLVPLYRPAVNNKKKFQADSIRSISKHKMHKKKHNKKYKMYQQQTRCCEMKLIKEVDVIRLWVRRFNEFVFYSPG